MLSRPRGMVRITGEALLNIEGQTLPYESESCHGSLRTSARSAGKIPEYLLAFLLS